MKPSARARAASYQEWVAKFQSYALSKGKPDAVIQTAFAGVKENPEISDRASKQPEFVTPVWSYLDRAVSDERVARGQQKYVENKALLAGIDHDYGVPPEHRHGHLGNRDRISAATLAMPMCSRR